MSSQHRSLRLRVEAPTLEPDAVFLDMLTGLSASSRTAAPRTARTAGLRMIVATATVAVVATATWAGGSGMGVPTSPVDGPALQEPSGPPSHGDVATPQRDVSISPGSPVSPGLPGTSSLLPRRADASSSGRDGMAESARSHRVDHGRPADGGNSSGKHSGKGAKKKSHASKRPRSSAVRPANRQHK